MFACTPLGHRKHGESDGNPESQDRLIRRLTLDRIISILYIKRERGLLMGLLGMAVAALATLFMLYICASETKENFDRALAKEREDAER
ncbi:hypothetical protein [Alicyclobacillus kakegawensis]|uniref:hypothetical protein n=1 Tax=Alicyclobacillus kakegawensis TaxID=392012 RepID=UPI000B1C17D7|nr:hypothetical protein [Alicyclobacillus kakegawensis]